MKSIIEQVEDSAYTMTTVCMNYGFRPIQLTRYSEGEVKPRDKTQAKLEKMMEDLRDSEKHKIKRHPSYGYATEYQIEQLMALGLGPDRDRILKQIEQQNKKKGKV